MAQPWEPGFRVGPADRQGWSSTAGHDLRLREIWGHSHFDFSRSNKCFEKFDPTRPSKWKTGCLSRILYKQIKISLKYLLILNRCFHPRTRSWVRRPTRLVTICGAGQCPDFLTKLDEAHIVRAVSRLNKEGSKMLDDTISQ